MCSIVLNSTAGNTNEAGARCGSDPAAPAALGRGAACCGCTRRQPLVLAAPRPPWGCGRNRKHTCSASSSMRVRISPAPRVPTHAPLAQSQSSRLLTCSVGVQVPGGAPMPLPPRAACGLALVRRAVRVGTGRRLHALVPQSGGRRSATHNALLDQLAESPGPEPGGSRFESGVGHRARASTCPVGVAVISPGPHPGDRRFKSGTGYHAVVALLARCRRSFKPDKRRGFDSRRRHRAVV